MLIRDTLGPAYEMHKATMLQQNLPMLPPATAAVTVKALFEIGFLSQEELNQWTVALLVGGPMSAPPSSVYPPPSAPQQYPPPNAYPPQPNMYPPQPQPNMYPPPGAMYPPMSQQQMPQPVPVVSPPDSTQQQFTRASAPPKRQAPAPAPAPAPAHAPAPAPAPSVVVTWVRYNVFGKQLKDITNQTIFQTEGGYPSITVKNLKTREFAVISRTASMKNSADIAIDTRVRISIHHSAYDSKRLSFDTCKYPQQINPGGNYEGFKFYLAKGSQVIARVDEGQPTAAGKPDYVIEVLQGEDQLLWVTSMIIMMFYAKKWVNRQLHPPTSAALSKSIRNSFDHLAKEVGLG